MAQECDLFKESKALVVLTFASRLFKSLDAATGAARSPLVEIKDLGQLGSHWSLVEMKDLRHLGPHRWK